MDVEPLCFFEVVFDVFLDVERDVALRVELDLECEADFEAEVLRPEVDECFFFALVGFFGGITFCTPADAPAPAGISRAKLDAVRRKIAATSVAAARCEAVPIPPRKLRSDRGGGK